MLNFILYFPLLISYFNGAENHTYIWEPNGISFTSSLYLHENNEENFWGLLDSTSSFLLVAERLWIPNCEPELLEEDVKKGAFRLAKLYHYKKIKNGGPLKNFKEGHYVICKDDGETQYVAFIIDRSKAYVYQIYIEDSWEDNTKAMEVINSLGYDSDK